MHLTGKTVLVSGANRGIGLELVTQLVKHDDIAVKKVFAACRTPDNADVAMELRILQAEHGEKVEILKLDVTKDEEIVAAVKCVEKMSPNGLNLLINNAGVSATGTALASVDRTKIRYIMEVNFISALMMCQAFSDLLKTAAAAKDGDSVNAAVVNISSELGSLANCKTGGTYPYRASKAAMNMMTRGLAQDLGSKSGGHGVVTLALHPGWVRTSMGGPRAPIHVRDSAAAILKVLDIVDASHNGSFLDYKGEVLPW